MKSYLAVPIHVRTVTRSDVFIRLHQEYVGFVRQRLMRWIKPSLYVVAVYVLFVILGLMVEGQLLGISTGHAVAYGMYGVVGAVVVYGYQFARWKRWSISYMNKVNRVIAGGGLDRFDYTLVANDDGVSMESKADGSRAVSWNEIESYLITPMTVRLTSDNDEWGMFAREYLGVDAFDQLAALTQEKVKKGVDTREGRR